MVRHDQGDHSDKPKAALLTAAVQHHQSGDLATAIRLYRTLIDREPENADAWHLLGVTAHQQGDHKLALNLIGTAIELNGAVADYHSNFGMVLLALKLAGRADAAFRKAIDIDPSSGKALSNLAGLLRRQGDVAAAVDYAKRALRSDDGDAETHNNLGNALMDCGRDQEWLEDAVASYRRAIQLQPDYALAHWNLSLALLTAGDLTEGFKEMSWRWRWSGFPAHRRHLEKPPLSADSNIKDKQVLLYAEQGLGDAIHFVRYARHIRGLGARVIVECPLPLVPLIRAAGVADEVFGEGDEVPEFDLQAPFLDLPAVCRTDLNNLPDSSPYLAVDPNLVSTWRSRISEYDGFKIGLNWCGNPESPVEKFRQLPVSALAALTAVKGVAWFSLQKELGRSDVPPAPEALDIIDTGKSPLQETAALITALDLVITTDTAIAHLAGALGKPAWVLLHQAPDWRWLAERTDSPWYPTLRLFRQKQPGNWMPVVDDLVNALKDTV